MHLIEVNSGVLAENGTSLNISVTKHTLPSTSVDFTLIITFPSLSGLFAKSLQVLLLPYFTKWDPKLQIENNNLIVSIILSRAPFTSELDLQLQIGIQLEQMKQNFVLEILESLKFSLKCGNLNEIFELFGIKGVMMDSSQIVMSLDSEDIPKEVLVYIQKNMEDFIPYLDVLEAIRPMLRTCQIDVVASFGELSLSAKLVY
jgi:hypothetical protein